MGLVFRLDDFQYTTVKVAIGKQRSTADSYVMRRVLDRRSTGEVKVLPLHRRRPRLGPAKVLQL